MSRLFIHLALVASFSSAALLAAENEPAELIEKWDPTLAISQEAMFDRLWSDTASSYFYGDDGIECDGDLLEVTLTGREKSKETSVLKFEYRAKQEEKPLCIWSAFDCSAQYVLNEKSNRLRLKKMNCDL